MLKNLRIIFTKEEKNLENLNKVLELLGESWIASTAVRFEDSEQAVGVCYYSGEDDGYDILYQSELNGTELSLAEFFDKYGEKKEESELEYQEHKDVAEPLHGFGEPLSCKVCHKVKALNNEWLCVECDGEFTEQQPALENERPEIVLPMGEYHIAFCNDGKMPEVMIYSVETQCVTEIRLNPFEITKRKKQTMDEIKEESAKEQQDFNRDYLSIIEKQTSANNAQVETNDMEGLNELPIVGEEDCNPEPDGIKAEFAKLGFEVPEFECELIAIDDDGQIVGFTYPNGSKTLTYFNKQGQAFEIDEELLRWENKDLTPIKPDEPKFKTGDWVYPPNRDIPIQVKQNMFGQSYSNWRQWKPKEGEWCVFWDEDTAYVIGKYRRQDPLEKDLYNIESFDCSYRYVAPLEFIQTLSR